MKLLDAYTPSAPPPPLAPPVLSCLQSKDLNDRAAQLSKAARQLEGAYRSSHSRFEKAYQHAASCCSAIIDLGATPPKAPDPVQVARKHGFDRIARMQAAQLHGEQAMGGVEERRAKGGGQVVLWVCLGCPTLTLPSSLPDHPCVSIAHRLFSSLWVPMSQVRAARRSSGCSSR